jgi:hypothetical protein
MGRDMETNEGSITDFAAMDDTALLAERARMRERLTQLPPDSPEHVTLAFVYDISTAEVTERARVAWSRAR